AQNHLDLGDLEQALSHLEPIERALAQPGDPWMRWRYALHARHTRARVELLRGAPEAALALVATECEDARRHQAPKVEARALVLRGSALLTLDRREEAEATLGEALGTAERIGYQRGVWMAHERLAETARRAGNTSAAAAHAAQARAVTERVGATLADESLRRLVVSGSAAR